MSVLINVAIIFSILFFLIGALCFERTSLWIKELRFNRELENHIRKKNVIKEKIKNNQEYVTEEVKHNFELLENLRTKSGNMLFSVNNAYYKYWEIKGFYTEYLEKNI